MASMLQGLPLLPVPNDKEGTQADEIADAVWATLVQYQKDKGEIGNLAVTLASCAFVRTVFANSTMLLADDVAHDIAEQIAGTVLAMLQDIIKDRPGFAPTTGTPQ
jgi:hypothetical protein